MLCRLVRQRLLPEAVLVPINVRVISAKARDISAPRMGCNARPGDPGVQGGYVAFVLGGSADNRFKWVVPSQGGRTCLNSFFHQSFCRAAEDWRRKHIQNRVYCKI